MSSGSDRTLVERMAEAIARRAATSPSDSFMNYARSALSVAADALLADPTDVEIEAFQAADKEARWLGARPGDSDIAALLHFIRSRRPGIQPREGGSGA